MKREIIIVNNFYRDPDVVVEYARALQYYAPFANKWIGSSKPEDMAIAGWHASFFKKAKECPFKSSETFICTLENITGEEIDRKNWDKDFAEDPETGAQIEPWPYLKDPTKPYGFDNVHVDAVSPRWNCAFHFKFSPRNPFAGVHDHARDAWNQVDDDGWTGLIYLNKNAPRESGLKIMRNKFGNNRERFTAPDRWELVDDLANVYNRLILVRGSYPHAGGPGFGRTHKDGRLFQTLFFKVKRPKQFNSVDIPLPR